VQRRGEAPGLAHAAAAQRAQEPIEGSGAGGGERRPQRGRDAHAMGGLQGRQQRRQDRDQQLAGQLIWQAARARGSARAPGWRSEAGGPAAAAPSAGPPAGVGWPLCDDAESYGNTRREFGLVPACRPVDTGDATRRRIRGALARSRDLRSAAGLSNTGCEATPSVSVTLLLRVIAGLTCPARSDRIGAGCHRSSAP
jgi:hypothetical protein